MKIQITLSSPPRSKKNSSRIIFAGGRPRLIPSKPFEVWNKNAQIQLAKWKSENVHQMIDTMVNCKAIFYLEVNRGDLVNFLQAVADALQEAGIVKNDSQLKSFDGSRLRTDKFKPRVELTLEDYVE